MGTCGESMHVTKLYRTFVLGAHDMLLVVIPQVEDDLIAKQQAAYSVAGVDESVSTTSEEGTLLLYDSKSEYSSTDADTFLAGSRQEEAESCCGS